MRIFFALFFATVYTVAAQTHQVPHKMQFGGITLTIRDDARKEIQKDVDALTQSPRHHNIKVERAKTYFPIIEKVFEEERVPDDFKYLVLQESALIADAVSTSNAVGFWQFKDFTAIEMGLRVDKEIDERLNIVSSSRAAARYFKKNNFYFNNWIYALQAYQMGAGGVLKSVKEHQNGVKHMEITSSTYWYVKKFLAHKIAFEEDVKGPGQIRVLSYENRNKKELSDIAKEVSVDAGELAQYNKWAKKGNIPDDRVYTVMIPVVGEGKGITIPDEAIARAPQSSAAAIKGDLKLSAAKTSGSRTKINGIVAIKATTNETPPNLASRAGVDLSSFVKWNDISISDRIIPEQYYLLGKKRVRASEAYHKVSAGENLWMVSQRYGVQLKKLKKFNRMKHDNDITPGSTLWLSSTKPKDSDKVVAISEVVQVDNAQTFSWAVNPAETQPTVSVKPIVVDTQELEVVPPPSKQKDSIQNIQVKGSTPTVLDSVKNNKVEVVVLEEKIDKTQHVVQTGETLYGIARRYSLSVMDLVTWNNLNLQEGIKVGQVIKLIDNQPVDKTPTVSGQVIETEHLVKSTDTLYSVARKYNVTIQEVMEWNDKKDFALSVGEKLKIKSK